MKLLLSSLAIVSANTIGIEMWLLSSDCNSPLGSTKVDVAPGSCYPDMNGGDTAQKFTCSEDGATVTQVDFTNKACDGTGTTSTYASDTCHDVMLFSVKVTCPGAPCFARDTHATLASGDSIPMSELKAGDLVLDGPSSTTRVIVNQHAKAAHLSSSLLDIEHSDGHVSLTPDHVLQVDGEWQAAREAIVGSKLGESKVSKVSSTTGGIINPLTTSGKILSDGVLASTYPEWIAGYMLGRSTASASSLLSFLFPATTQSYYDAHLEHFFQSTSPKLVALKASLPAPLVTTVFVVADLAVSAGLIAFTLASLKVVLAMAAIAAISQARK